MLNVNSARFYLDSRSLTKHVDLLPAAVFSADVVMSARLLVRDMAP